MPKPSQGMNGIPHAFMPIDIGAKVGIGGLAKSDTSSSFTTTGTSLADVTGLSVTISTTGRPIYVSLIANAATGTSSYLGVSRSDNDPTIRAKFAILRNGLVIATYDLQSQAGVGENTKDIHVPASSLHCIDPITPGVYTYTVQAAVVGAGSLTVTIVEAVLVAYEI